MNSRKIARTTSAAFTNMPPATARFTSRDTWSGISTWSVFMAEDYDGTDWQEGVSFAKGVAHKIHFLIGPTYSVLTTMSSNQTRLIGLGVAT